MGDYAARRGSARLPMEAPVHIRFPGVDEPYEGTIGNIGMAGMFVAGGAPMPAGTLMHFEFRPSPQWHELRGRGRIVWARHRPNAEGEPAGMGVRFIELDERGRRGVRWLIETYQSVGGKPFETWSVPAQFTRGLPAAGDVLATQEIVPLPPAQADRPAWLKKPWPLLAAGLGLVVLVSGWALLGGDSESEPNAAPLGAVQQAKVAQQVEAEAPPEPSPDAATTEPTSSAPAATGAQTATTTADGSPTVSAILTELVGEWSVAWSSQDVNRYLAFYAPDFAPESGESRATWAGQRAGRLAGPEFIRVGADGVQVLDENTATPRTVFTQSYESSTFSDQVTKSLTWVRSEGTWRILNERSAP